MSVVQINLDKKVALVTGAGRGIGAATALLLAQAGASVVVSDVMMDSVTATASDIARSGLSALALHHDVTDEAGWESAIARTISEFGSLDIVVNNAGLEETVFLTDIDATAMRRLLDVNVAGVLLGHKHAIRAMRPGGSAGRGGSIVNLSSVAGLVSSPGLGVYSASKGAVRLLSKAAAVECGQLGYGIRVNSVNPGVIETAMGDKLLADYVGLGIFPDMDAARTGFVRSHPIGRLGKATEIASAVLFLASDLSSFVTGSELICDGGLTAT